MFKGVRTSFKHVITITTMDLIKKCCPCAILEYILITKKKKEKKYGREVIFQIAFFLEMYFKLRFGPVFQNVERTL